MLVRWACEMSQFGRYGLASAGGGRLKPAGGTAGNGKSRFSTAVKRLERMLRPVTGLALVKWRNVERVRLRSS